MNAKSPSSSPDRLTVFAFLWACQALVHHEFYKGWVDAHDPAGWLVMIAGVALLLRPSNATLLVALLLSSIVYNVRKWPFVVNHVLVESMINLAILAAVSWTFVEGRRAGTWTGMAMSRERAFDRFAPVVRVMLVAMYYFAVLAKLNTDFLDPEFSCVTAMYDDLLRRLPFLPVEQWAQLAAIWGTVAIELSIPLLLTFRRTQWIALAIGLPFHLMLGLIGHRTFSALAYALYALFLIDPLTALAGEWWRRARDRWGDRRIRAMTRAMRFAVVGMVALLVAVDLAGSYRARVGPLAVYRIAWVIWILWSLALILVYGTAIRRMLAGHGDDPSGPRSGARPGPLWALVALVVLNGLSQYLGLKTETCFTMYSNLRTEGGVNNHLFMPALRLAGYQDDLVDIVATTHPELQPAVDGAQYLTFFEFRRIVSSAKEDFQVVYRRGEREYRYELRGGVPSDPELAEPQNLLLRKLLYFRPVPKSDRCPCQH